MHSAGGELKVYRSDVQCSGLKGFRDWGLRNLF